MTTHLEKLGSLQKEIKILDSISAVLDWDQNCIMPPEGAEYRGSQKGYIAQKRHELHVSSEYQRSLEGALKECEGLSPDDMVSLNLRKSLRELNLTKKVSGELVAKLAEAAAVSQTAWEKARAENNFKHFLDPLRKLLDLSREKSTAYGMKTIYDGAIADFEVDMDTDKTAAIFDPLKAELVPFLKSITTSKGIKFEPTALKARVPAKVQEQLGRKLALDLGFHSEDGVLYTSSHPFCSTLGPRDYRITTRYLEDYFVSSFTAVGHEVGHSLYERGVPAELRSQAAGSIASSALHESQSLFWEKRVVSSRAFLKGWHETMKKCDPSMPQDLTLDQLYASFNKVEPSLIRIEADEVTYPLHVIIRFELEKALFNDNLDPKLIPELWNAKYREYLGITPPTDSVGCLQDIHWACGLFGYFPSYAIGHLISAQYTETLEKEHGPIDEILSQGRLDIIKGFLGRYFYQYGGVYGARELTRKISGRELDHTAYLRYLKKKYSYLY